HGLRHRAGVLPRRDPHRCGRRGVAGLPGRPGRLQPGALAPEKRRRGACGLGPSPPKLVAAPRAQLEQLPLTIPIFLNRRQADLAELLAEVLPGRLQYSFFCSSGTEAVGGALKLARVYTGRSEIISAERAFHGKTMGSLS